MDPPAVPDVYGRCAAPVVTVIVRSLVTISSYLHLIPRVCRTNPISSEQVSFCFITVIEPSLLCCLTTILYCTRTYEKYVMKFCIPAAFVIFGVCSSIRINESVVAIGITGPRTGTNSGLRNCFRSRGSYRGLSRG